MHILICICSKSPNPLLYECIHNLYKIQIHIHTNTHYKICVIDSDSDDLTNYDKIKNDFPNVDILFIKNKNYEYGAYKYALNLYSDYDIYFCIQDTIIINNYINLDILNNTTVYTYHHNSGYNYYSQELKETCINKYLKPSGLIDDLNIYNGFIMAQHNIFIVNNTIMKNIFNTLTIAPDDKEGSCSYERHFGLYFIIKKINTINLKDYVTKTNGGR